MKKMKLYITLISLFFIFPIAAQEGEFQKVEGVYRNFSLSMTVEECISALEQDGYFRFQGLDQPSLLRESEEVLLDSPGQSYIHRGWFQFQSDKLVVITIQLNPERIDYYSLFSQLTSKYGSPDKIEPEKSIWINEESQIEMELSRPLQVKYRDKAFFDQLIEEGRSRESYEEILRDRFLEEF